MDNTFQLFIAAPDTNLFYSGSYSPLLVLISVSLAILAAFASLNAAVRIDYQHDRLSRAIWIAVSALTLGVGIWAMHFVGMLALNLPCGIYYDPWITLLSMIPGILASGIALGTVRRCGHRPLFSSILLGAGIGAMHYTGMAALRLDGFVRYDPKLFALSILVAVALSYLALSVKNRLACTNRRCTLLIAVIIGSAVSGMHYTAMSAAYFVRGNVDALPPTAFTPNTLALLVSLTTVFLALIALAVASVSGNRQVARQLRESEERWKFALEGAGDGVWDWNPQTDEAHFSRRWKEMIGYGEHEFPNTGAAWMAHLHPEDTPDVQNTIRRYFSGELPDYAVEFRMRCKDGAWKWILARGMVVERNEAGKPVRMIGTHTDIDYRKRAEEAMLLHASVYDNTWEGIMITDAQANIVSINAAFTEVTGYTLDEVRGQNPRFLKSGYQDSAFYQGLWENLLRTGHWRGEIWNKKKNGEVFAEILSIGVVRNAHGELTNFIGAFADITPLKKTQQHLETLANFDPLTQLPNRRLFNDRLAHEIKKAHRSGKLIALMFIDLDNFKEINDTLGHDIGDRLLEEAARRITGCLREYDTVARLGGDEFGAILPDLEHPLHAERIAQSIIDRLIAPFQLDNDQAYISASIGITLYPTDADNAAALMKNADQAMYLSKNRGRNRYSYFTAELQEAAQQRMRLLADLRNALKLNQFSVHYQPIVDLTTGRIRKAEALLRWTHPELGMVGPAQFIPIAEESGLIVEIGDWVYRQALQQAADWRARLDPAFQISINRSPVQFRRLNIQQKSWLNDLQTLGLSGDSVVIEITEGLLLNAEADIRNELMAFRASGVEVAIDDFGTGYSSLAYLQKFDIDYLKIDRAFVSNLHNSAADLALVEAIIVMAHTIGLKVIAEGVETEEQHAILKAAGCDYAQGYLFSRPVPPEAFERMLHAHD